MKELELMKMEDIQSIYYDAYCISKIKDNHPTNDFNETVVCNFSAENKCPLADTHTVSFECGQLKPFKECGETIVRYEPMFTIENKKLFWEAFDSYIFNHRDDILKSIERYFIDTIESNKSIVNSEIKRLKDFLEDVECYRKGIMK